MALLGKSLIGMVSADEGFYLANVQRFLQGDRLFLDDWHVGSMGSLLSTPLYLLYKGVTGSTDGIYLFFRICYVCTMFVLSLVIYKSLSNGIGRFYALVLASTFLLYAKSSIGTFSYNTISYVCLWIACMIMYLSIEGTWSYKKETCLFVISGLCYSVSVFMMPTLILLVILIPYLFAIKVMNGRRFLLFIGGGGIALGIFLLYVISMDTTIAQFIQAIPNLLTMDTYGSNRNYLADLINIPIIIGQELGNWCIRYLILLTLTIIACIVRKTKDVPQFLIFGLFGMHILFLFFHVQMYTGRLGGESVGMHFIPFTLFGIAVLLLLQEKISHTVLMWYIIGAVSMVAFYYGSNTGIHAVSSGASISFVGVVLTLRLFALENKVWYPKLTTIAVGCPIIVLLVITAYCRLTYFYKDDAFLVEAHSTIVQGPATGITTTVSKAQDYNEIYEDIISQVSKGDSFIIFPGMPMAYLFTQATCASYTTWPVAIDDERLMEYLEVREQKPSVVYIIGEEDVFSEMKYESREFLDLLESDEYVKIQGQAGTFYEQIEMTE